ncbi:MAG: ImmA/IrrE family metallo-endopeptidase [Dialister sp.]|uniref:ImmA/IrrE family metallo-endopeptidase n=1 Tax=Dialister sp. TaxID=1955814 RepID=UPI00257A07B9|nr:ImmA/IrrE family metallo-endopeptidase [Dialister sp.]MBS6295947.1 ImmA/IrrE family metallo-endopeptidase [Dialister sp.]
MDTRSVVDNLCKKYKTRNPYELIDAMGIILQYGEHMENVRGFYLYDSRVKLICVGNNLPDHIERFVLSHELGHAIMHKRSSAPFLQSTFLSVSRLEREANKFATELMISDEDIMEHWEFTIDEWAMFYGLPREIIELRFK